jgi:hypothetical protein
MATANAKGAVRIPILTPDRRFALSHLCEAFETSKEVGDSPLSYGCQHLCLHTFGITSTTLRWLVALGLAEHYRETTAPYHKQRTFEEAPNLMFTPASCFILSWAGASLAISLKARSTKLYSRERVPGSGDQPRAYFASVRGREVAGAPTGSAAASRRREFQAAASRCNCPTESPPASAHNSFRRGWHGTRNTLDSRHQIATRQRWSLAGPKKFQKKCNQLAGFGRICTCK